MSLNNVGNTEEDNLCIMWYDEKNDNYDIALVARCVGAGEIIRALWCM